MHDPSSPPDSTSASSSTPSGVAARRAPTLARTPITASVAAAWDHPRVLVCALATLLALPMLLIGLVNTSGSGSTYNLQTESASYRGPTTSWATQGLAAAKAPSTTASSSQDQASTTSTQATTATTDAPSNSSDSTTSTTGSGEPSSTTQAWQAPATTEWTPPDTTVAPWQAPATAPPATAPPVTAAPTTAPPTTSAPSGGRSESGQATWYAHTANGCASRTVPRGTWVTVTASNGKSTSCVIDDYGPFGDGRIIDLSKQSFSQLASLGTGVISVTVTW